jgi:thymidylate kinase
LAPTEGASRRTPFFLKDDLTAFNTWSACYALSQILEALHHAERYQIAILDRGLFDSLVWFRLLTDLGNIEEETCSVVQQFIMLDQWRSVIDLVVLFTADPDTAMARENKGKLIEKHGRAMNPQFLSQMNTAYASVAEEYQNEFAQFLEVDTSAEAGLSEKDAAAIVVDYALGCLEAPPEPAGA